MTNKLSEAEARQALEADQVPEQVKIKQNAFAIEALIDPTPQPLRKLLSYHKMTLNMPLLVSDEAKIVLHLLFSCFEKAGHVSEGLIGDLLWGFQQVDPPTHPSLTLKGLFDLKYSGYIKFQAKDGEYVDRHSDELGGAWVRYTDKLKELVYNPEVLVVTSKG